MSDDQTTETTTDQRPESSDDAPRGDGMEPCPRCSMRVRRSEMSIHLAHAHNVGPSGDRKRKGGGGRRR